MLQKIILVLSVLLLSGLSAQSSFDRANEAAEKAAKSLDCEFEDCKPEPPKVIIKKQYVPVVIVKEKVVTKEVPVEVEKVIYKDRVVYKDRVIHDEEVPAPTPKIVTGRTYNTMFIDISVPNDPTFISDYIHITRRAGGFDWNEIKKKFLTAPTSGKYELKITGMIEIPAHIHSDRIYIKPVSGSKVYTNLVIDGTKWTTSELNILNGYKDSNVIPFSITISDHYYSKGNVRFISDAAKYFPTISFSISNKPTVRGERKEFVKTKVFINK